MLAATITDTLTGESYHSEGVGMLDFFFRITVLLTEFLNLYALNVLFYESALF